MTEVSRRMRNVSYGGELAPKAGRYSLQPEYPPYMQILGSPAGRHTLLSANNRDKHITRIPNPAQTRAASLVLEYQGFPGDPNFR
jgi:hypothetical protein